MTPSWRVYYSENMRRLRMAEARDPLENALYEFIALSSPDKREMVQRYNRIFGDSANPSTLHYSEPRVEMPITGETE